MSQARLLQFDKELTKDIVSLGGRGIEVCYQCGTCTATCPLSEERPIAIRRLVKYIQLGLKDRIVSDLTPWLCYACGECSTACPKNADPAGLMMALRRYLITRYDWTGLARWLHRSLINEIIGILLLFFAGIAAVLFLHGPIITTRVELATFAPLHIVEAADAVVGTVLAVLLISNIFNMYRYSLRGVDKSSINLSDYVKGFLRVPAHFITQMKLRRCDSKKKWIDHLLLMWGYVVAFILVVLFLPYFQTNSSPVITSPFTILWHFSFVALTYGSGVAIVQRLVKKDVTKKHSHPTDWMFIILLFAVSLTGLLTHIFRLIGLPIPTYVIYSVHLSLAVPLLVLEVPFAKWSHLAYRPFAEFFAYLQAKAW